MPSVRNHSREVKMLGGLNKTCTKEGHSWVSEYVLSVMTLKMEYLCISHDDNHTHCNMHGIQMLF